MASRLREHLAENFLNESLQSAYKELHSTETALLKVQNDLLTSIDSEGGAILVLLDLSAAFDTIDHQILFKRLYDLGIREHALDWFISYLCSRKQSVNINGIKSTPRDLPYGVPQGSVLGPILFTLYTSPLGSIAKKFGLCFHLYADDTQLYITFKPSSKQSIEQSVNIIQTCIVEIKQWMTNNMLKLNGDKTEILVITGPRYKNKTLINNITIDSDSVSPSTKVRNLGVIFDQTLSAESFINATCRSAWYNLRNINRVRKSLTMDSAKILVQAYITSRLDYCNSLLYGAPSTHLNRLQKIQNYAARITTLTPKRSHISPVLAQLHWLPVRQRIEYKILLYTYKALNELAPIYLTDLIECYIPPRTLRSADQNLLRVPATRLKNYGMRAFATAAPALWNTLPVNIKGAGSIGIFKKRLKTHLFKEAFL